MRVTLLQQGTGPLRRFTSFHVYSACSNPSALADLVEPGSYDIPATPRFDGFTTYVNDAFQAVRGEDLSAAAKEAPTSATQLGPHTPSRPSSLTTSPRHSLSLEASQLLPPPQPLTPSPLLPLPSAASAQPPQPPAVHAIAPEPPVPAPNPAAAWLPCPPNRPGGGGVGHPPLLPSRPVGFAAAVGRSCERKPASRPGFSPLSPLSPSTSRPATPSRPSHPAPRSSGGLLRSPVCHSSSAHVLRWPSSRDRSIGTGGGGGSGNRSSCSSRSASPAVLLRNAAAVEQRQPLAPSTSTPSYMRSTASFNAKTSTCTAARVARVLVLAADEVH